MELYVVVGQVDYEFTEIVGIFESKEVAERVREYCEYKNKYNSVEVDEWDSNMSMFMEGEHKKAISWRLPKC